MIRWRNARGVAVLASVALSGCASLDRFSDRVAGVNQNIAAADVDNVVRNVVRASLTEPMSFVAVTKVTGGRTTDFTLGLPTITFGPGQTTAQKQSVFGSNSTKTSQTYSVELAQLRTDTFTKGLMNPVANTQLENFSHQGISRELLFYLFVDSIRLDVNDEPHVFRNDPLQDDPKLCPAPTSEKEREAYEPGRAIAKGKPCPFRTFQYLLDTALGYGVAVQPGKPKPPVDTQAHTVDLKVSRLGDPPPAPTTDPSAKPPRSGDRLCFNPTLWTTRPTGAVAKYICGADGTDEEGFLEVEFESVTARIGVSFRSPYAMFEYLGAVSRLPPDQHPVLVRSGPRYVDQDRRLFPLQNSVEGCFTRIEYKDQAYCLRDNAYDAKAAVKVLILLLQMNTNRTDLPSSAVTLQF